MSVQGVVTGNIAETPLKAKSSSHMSPTEKAAFEVPVEVPQVDVLEATPATELLKWETVSAEKFSMDRVGDSTNSFVRTTRRLKVEGGWIYSISTQGIGYIRGNCSATSSESSVFVPELKSKR